MNAAAILKLAQAAVKYAEAVQRTRSRKAELSEAYRSWHSQHAPGITITRQMPAWAEMMAATKAEYRLAQNAKASERRAQAALLRAAWEVEP